MLFLFKLLVMDKNVIEIEKRVDEIFDDFLNSLKSHVSDSITHHTSHIVEKKGSLGGQELFSKFTADIIKEEVIFTR